jgi:hypothetical protein
LGIYDILILFSTGLVAGFLSGFLGIGGGVIVVPILYNQLCGRTDEVFLVVSTISLGVVLVAASKASYRYVKEKKFYKQALIPVGLGALAGPLPGNLLCGMISENSRIIFFSVVTAVLAVKLLAGKDGEKSERIPEFNKIKMFSFGMFMGMISSMTGTGGGFVLVPLLVLFLNFNPKKAVGVSSIVMIVNPISSLIGRYYIGVFEVFPVSLFIIYFLIISAGTLVTSGLGVSINIKASNKQFKYIAGIVYLLVAVQMYIKAI